MIFVYVNKILYILFVVYVDFYFDIDDSRVVLLNYGFVKVLDGMLDSWY